jgi:hypothetical protein
MLWLQGWLREAEDLSAVTWLHLSARRCIFVRIIG